MNTKASGTGLKTGELEFLLSRLAAPLSQLRTLAVLMDSGKEISARSVLAIARQIADLFEKSGLEQIGSLGEEFTFGPRLADPLSGSETFSRGETVVIRFIGCQYRVGIIRKALIE